MNLEVGTYFSIKTSTKDDVFGEVIWKITAIGIKMPDGGNGVELTMMGGTGPSARRGYCLTDSVKNVQDAFAKGKAKSIPKAQAEAWVNSAEAKPSTGGISIEY